MKSVQIQHCLASSKHLGSFYVIQQIVCIVVFFFNPVILYHPESKLKCSIHIQNVYSMTFLANASEKSAKHLTSPLGLFTLQPLLSCATCLVTDTWRRGRSPEMAALEWWDYLWAVGDLKVTLSLSSLHYRWAHRLTHLGPCRLHCHCLRYTTGGLTDWHTWGLNGYFVTVCVTLQVGSQTDTPGAL